MLLTATAATLRRSLIAAAANVAPMRPTVLATLACVIAAACWAASAVIAAGAFERGMSPERLAESRVITSLIPLAACLLVARRDLMRPPRAALPAVIAFGACLVAVNCGTTWPSRESRSEWRSRSSTPHRC